MTSQIGTGLMYYGRYTQTFGFIFISILTIVGTIFIAIKMNKYKSWKSVNGRVNDNSMIEFKVDGENYSIPALYYDIEGEEQTVYYNPNNIKSTATTQNNLMWNQLGWYALAIIWPLCILCGIITLITYKSRKGAQIVGAFDLANMMFNN